MTTLGLKEMGKFLWEGREKFCALLENAKKTWYSILGLVFHFGVGCHASFPQKPVVKEKIDK